VLVDGPWLSAHLVDTGTTRAGTSVSTHEFAFYRLASDRIVEVWGDLDHRRLLKESGQQPS
jgi:predicted ester cyclase